MTFISGHNPDLVIYDRNAETKRIDLKSYDTVEKIEELFKTHHIYKKESTCSDSHRDCKYWASVNECQKNSAYMKKHCPYSCESCPKVEL